jgi:hypothetical protein
LSISYENNPTYRKKKNLDCTEYGTISQKSSAATFVGNIEEKMQANDNVKKSIKAMIIDSSRLQFSNFTHCKNSSWLQK